MSNELFSRLLAGLHPPLSTAAPEWKYAEQFTVRQVAFLWAGFEPQTNLETDNHNRPTQLNALLQMLLAAINIGRLPATKKYDVLPADEDALLKREDLIAFCESKQQYPAFLFETLPNTTDSEKKNLEETKEISNAPSFAEKDTGRPRSYAWDRIAAATIIIEQDVGLVNPSTGAPLEYMELCRKLQEYVENGFSLFSSDKKHPAPDISQIQKMLGGFIRQYLYLRGKHEKDKTK